MPFCIKKDKDATLDYQLDWEDWLNGDTIQSSQWIVPNGITKESDSFDSNNTLIWLSGGTIGVSYQVINRITTVGTTEQRIEDRTIVLKIVDK